MRGYDQWKTASPYDDCDDTRCAECGTPLPDAAVEFDQPWVEEGHCSVQCALTEPPPPCSRPFWELLAYTFSAKNPSDTLARITQETGMLSSWLEQDVLQVGRSVLVWPCTHDEFFEFMDEIGK